MKIGIIGTGYVGLTQSVCMASYLTNNEFIGIDIDETKVDSLNNGIPTIYEDGLEELLKKDLSQGNLKFSSEYANLVDCQVIFIAVGTPTDDNGIPNLTYLNKAFDQVVNAIKDVNPEMPRCIVIKSTVPPGTCETLAERVSTYSNLFVVSNPEYLREGIALNDFLNPDKVTLGFNNNQRNNVNFNEVVRMMAIIYTPIAENKILITDLATSQMVKYACNSFLAMKIAFINELSDLCKVNGANIEDVAKQMGYDKRISPLFLQPGPGYGGSCFSKDVRGLCSTIPEIANGYSLLRNIENSNNAHAQRCFLEVSDYINSNYTKIKNILILGVAFKAGTDDVRYSKALEIANHIVDLSEGKYNVTIHDPEALSNVHRGDSDLINYTDCGNEQLVEYLVDADVVVVLTEWNQYKQLFSSAPTRENQAVFDFRNIVPKRFNPIKY